MKVLLDGDVLTYKAGFIAESKLFYVFNDDEDKNQMFLRKKDALDYMEVVPDCRLEEELVVQPVTLCYGAVNAMIKSILSACGTEDYIVYLTDTKLEANFRSKIAKSYKANRKKSKKPTHYEAIRKYIFKKHPTIMVSGQEADDAMGIEQCRTDEETIIASIDKDMMMIPGEHINLATLERITSRDVGELRLSKSTLKGTGFKWFCAQLLLGDVVDNIQGINGYGPVKVLKLLGNCGTIKECWDKINSVYSDKDALVMNSHLLWIRRAEGQTYKDFLNDNI